MVYAPSYANLLYLMNLATIKSLTSIQSGPIWKMHYQQMLTPLFLSGNRKNSSLHLGLMARQSTPFAKRTSQGRKLSATIVMGFGKSTVNWVETSSTWCALRGPPSWRTYLTTHFHIPSDFGTFLTDWPIVLPFLTQSPLTTKYSSHLIPRLKLSTIIWPQSSTHVQSFLQISTPHDTRTIISVKSSWIKRTFVMLYWS